MGFSLWDSLFLRRRYAYRRALEKYSGALAQSASNLQKFSFMLAYVLEKTIQLANASTLMFDQKTRDYLICASGEGAAELKYQYVSGDSALIRELKSKKKELVLDRMEKNARHDYSELIAEMKQLRAALVLPGFSKVAEPALLMTANLGKRLSGESFTRGDIGYLKKFMRRMTSQLFPLGGQAPQ